MKVKVISYEGEGTWPIAVFPEDTSWEAVEEFIRFEVQKWCWPPDGEFEVHFEEYEEDIAPAGVAVTIIDKDGYDHPNDHYVIQDVELISPRFTSYLTGGGS